MSLTGASFFTGAGGFDIGFEQAGVEIKFQCEKDSFANQLLEEKYPNIPRTNDITKVQPSEIPYADIYFGGFPCQDASIAGNRRGLKGERTGLFFEFVRLVKANQPKWIVLENVTGLLCSGGREDFKLVIETLAECGYSVSWRVLDSQYFGVPQQRRRIFIVGCLGDWRSPFNVLFEYKFEATNGSKSSKNRTEVTEASRNRPIGIGTQFLSTKNRKLNYKNVVGTLCASDKGYAVLQKGSPIRYTTPIECERLMGFEDNWTEGFSDTQRYKMLGNAVVVPVAKFLAERIIAVEQLSIYHEAIAA